MGCSHKEVVNIVVDTLINWGYIVKMEAWVSKTLNSIEKFKFNIANAFLGKNSPWISLHNPEFQTRLDVVGIYYDDCMEMPLHTFFARKSAEEITFRTILIEVEHRHSLEEAVGRIKDFPAGKKIIVWTRGRIGGFLENIPIIVARDESFGCYVPELPKILQEHIESIRKHVENTKESTNPDKKQSEEKERSWEDLHNLFY